MNGATVLWNASPDVQRLADEVEDRIVSAHREWVRKGTGVSRLMLRTAATAADAALARAVGNPE
jgi:hypothetical protein